MMNEPGALQKFRQGETLTPEEVDQVATWVREDFGPAVQKMSDAIVAAYKPVFESISNYFASPQGQALVAIALQRDS